MIKASKVMMIDNYDSFTFNLIQLLEECGCVVELFKNDEVELEQCKKFKKILISPGAGLPQEAGKICTLIKELAPSHSILGICLGHQAIGQVFGGQLYRLTTPMHGQQQEVIVQDTNDLLFRGLPNRFQVGLYHSWAIAKPSVSSSWHVTAVGERDIVMALTHLKYDVRGIQFHPESVMTSLGKKLINNWLLL